LRDFTLEPGLQLRVRDWHHVAGEDTHTVFQNKTPVDGFSFEAPRAAAGRYLLLIYDGTEGGGHYTWDFVTVTAITGGGDDDDEFIFALVATLVAGGLVLALAIRFRRRAR